MSAHELMRELNAAGAVLTVRGRYLDVDAPTEVLSEAMLARLKHHKPELLRLLAMRTEPCRQAHEPGQHGVPVDHKGLPVGSCQACDGLSFWRGTRDDPWRCIACLEAESVSVPGGRAGEWCSLPPSSRLRVLTNPTRFSR
jgi:TubC N-terminal docking domain